MAGPAEAGFCTVFCQEFSSSRARIRGGAWAIESVAGAIAGQLGQGAAKQDKGGGQCHADTRHGRTPVSGRQREERAFLGSDDDAAGLSPDEWGLGMYLPSCCTGATNVSM